MGKWLVSNWERIAFTAVGFLLLSFSFTALWSERLTEASATFGMAFLSFIYASLARFKRFKGLGFEAELWEDKQKEAAELVERLKGVVSIYTRETIMTRVMMGRWGGSGSDWKSHWALFDELSGHHSELGQTIDFSDLRSEMEAVFVFDMVLRQLEGVQKPVRDGCADAMKKMQIEVGSEHFSHEQYDKKSRFLKEMQEKAVVTIEQSRKTNLAQETLDWAKSAQDELQSRFAVEIDYGHATMDNLKKIARARSQTPIKVTDELIALTEIA